MIRLTRRYRFCASHRLHSPCLSEAENREVYGKCNNPHGHGHNYTLEVSVTGPLDEATGQVAPVDRLDRLVHEQVLERLNNRNLNVEVPEFAGVVPTTENLALEIRRRLSENWGKAFNGLAPGLGRIRIYETPRNIFEVTGIV
jgi:6-pyruvoyltetrahydropterin/6-carboxytetrahydropterin synthase